MSISDDLMWKYIELLSFETLDTIAQWKSDVAAGGNPRDIKCALHKRLLRASIPRRTLRKRLLISRPDPKAASRMMYQKYQ